MSGMWLSADCTISASINPLLSSFSVSLCSDNISIQSYTFALFTHFIHLSAISLSALSVQSVHNQVFVCFSSVGCDLVFPLSCLHSSHSTTTLHIAWSSSSNSNNRKLHKNAANIEGRGLVREWERERSLTGMTGCRLTGSDLIDQLLLNFFPS